MQTVRFALLGLALTLVMLWFWRSNRSHPERLRAAALLVALYGIASLIAVVGGVSTRTSESDRFLYLPSAFLCMLLTLMVDGIPSRTLPRAAFYAVFIACYFQLRSGMLNWRTASETIERIIADTPAPPQGGRLLVLNLPSDHRGAYIFRHGYPEALLLSGRDAAQVVVIEDDVEFPLQSGDRRIRWTADGFVEVPGP